MSIFIWVAIVLFIAWILGFTVFHVASALIHILVVVAIIAVILHFVRSAARAA
jgi:membrane protein DedA with SNARE-associated domain